MSGSCSRSSPSSWPKGQPPNGVPLQIEANPIHTVSGCGPVALPASKEAVLLSCGQKTATVEENAEHVLHSIQVVPDQQARPALVCGTTCIPLRQGCAALRRALVSLRPGR